MKAAQTPAGVAGLAAGAGWRRAGPRGCWARPRPRRCWPRPGSPCRAAVAAPTLDAACRCGRRPCARRCALKGLGFAHKTEAGAVRLGLASLEGQAEMPGADGLSGRGDGDGRGGRGAAGAAARSGLRRDADAGDGRGDGRGAGRYGDAGGAGDASAEIGGGAAAAAAVAAAGRLSRAGEGGRGGASVEAALACRR